MSYSVETDSISVAPDVTGVVAWLVDGARTAATSSAVLSELCRQLTDSGIPLWRVAVFVQTLHPLIMARSFVWRPGDEVEVYEAPFTIVDDEGFLASPVLRVRTTGETIRRHLADPRCPMDFPF